MRAALLTAAALLAATPAIAQDAKAPSAAEMTEAQDVLSLIVSALNSKDVPQETKNGLFGCLYENPLKKLGEGSSAVFAKNPQLDAKDATQRLIVLARICGAPLPEAKAAPADAKEGGR